MSEKLNVAVAVICNEYWRWTAQCGELERRDRSVPPHYPQATARCARAASSHAVAAPPSSVMNSSLQNGAENAMSIRIGYLPPTRERIMAEQSQAAPLPELAERAERVSVPLRCPSW